MDHEAKLVYQEIKKFGNKGKEEGMAATYGQRYQNVSKSYYRRGKAGFELHGAAVEGDHRRLVHSRSCRLQVYGGQSCEA